MRGKKPERRPLTPEQARQGRRGIRRALAIGALNWLVVGVILAASYSRFLIPYLALAALYLLSIPFVVRAVDRDIERHTVDSAERADELDQLARGIGLH
jgi:hypothetical protein